LNPFRRVARRTTNVKVSGEQTQMLAQGCPPPDILKDAVMNEFVPSQLN